MGQFDLKIESCPELDRLEAAFRTTRRKSIGFMRTTNSQNNHTSDLTIVKKIRKSTKKKMITPIVLNPIT